MESAGTQRPVRLIYFPNNQKRNPVYIRADLFCKTGRRVCPLHIEKKLIKNINLAKACHHAGHIGSAEI